MNPRYIRYITRVIHLIMLPALLIGLAPAAMTPVRAAPGDLTRISVDSSGTQANAGSFGSKLSADGRYVAFVSDATNLVPDDTNNTRDVFVKDRQTGATTRVSVVSQTGAQANNDSGPVAISGDGRYVAFYSEASNLVSGDVNGLGDIFVHDRQTNLTTRISVDSSGNEANGASSDYYLAISSNGRYVAFPSEATNLVSGDTNNVTDIFVHDCQTGQTRRVSVASNGVEANGNSFGVDISNDGRYVAFSSSATNLVTGDTNGGRDVFVYDLQTGSTTRVSVNTRGEEADGGSSDPAISGDGRYVVFLSASGNLDPRADEYRYSQLVYVHDRQIGQTMLASVYSEGGIMEVGLFDQPTISNNGRYVAFSFYEKGDNNGIMHIWVRDLQTGESIRVEGGNDSSFRSSLSADGRIVAFSSGASNLVSGDTNGAGDVFAREVAYGPERNPTVASITPDCGFSTPVCTYPTGASVSFIVIFSEPVTGVGTDDFSLEMLESVSGASITGISGTGVEYFVTVNTGTGDGKLRLNLVDNDSIMDTKLNLLGGPGIGNGDKQGHTYLIDRSVPVVTGITRAESDPTTAAEVRFTVTFSEEVWPLRPDDFVLSTTGSISGATITAISPREDEYTCSIVYTVTVNTGSGSGTMRLDLVDDDTIADCDSHPPLGGIGSGNGNFTTGEAYTIDRNVPGVPSVTGSLRTDVNPTNADTVHFNVTFSEAVSGVDVSDFTPVITGNITNAVVTEVNGTGNSYGVSVNAGLGDGTLRLDVPAGATITDVDGNPLAGLPYSNGESYTIDNAEPAVVSSARASLNNPTNLPTVDFTVTFSEPVQGVDASDFVSGAAVSGGPAVHTVSVNTDMGDGDLRLQLPVGATITDLAGNPLTSLPIMIGEVYRIDKTAPVVISNMRADANPVTADGAHFNVNFSETVNGVDAGDFMLTTTGSLSGASITGVSGSANAYSVTVAVGNGNGTLRIDLIDNDSVQDLALNPLGGTGMGNGNFTTGEVYTIDKIPPTILGASFRSTGQNDGWVLESKENSNVGGSKNSNASIFKLGDDSQDRQFRAVLHFPTYYLPDNAVITQAILMIKEQDVVGTDPFTTHQNISIDIRKGYFNNNPLSFGSLQNTDYQAPADRYMVGTVQNNPVGGWYWALLESRAFPYISLTDVTQLRLAFQLDDNDDMGDDYIRFHSGDYESQKNRPHLLIEYYVPR